MLFHERTSLLHGRRLRSCSSSSWPLLGATTQHCSDGGVAEGWALGRAQGLSCDAELPSHNDAPNKRPSRRAPQSMSGKNTMPTLKGRSNRDCTISGNIGLLRRSSVAELAPAWSSLEIDVELARESLTRASSLPYT